MWTPLLLSFLSAMQGVGEGTAQGSRESLEAVLARASRQSDLDGAGLVLASLLSDGATLRAAFLTPAALDERSTYIFFRGDWGRRAKVAWKDCRGRQRIMVESVSAKPELIRSVLRADRYATYIASRRGRGAATINTFPFFEYSRYADDLVETFIETLGPEVTRPAKAVRSLDGLVLHTADEVEVDLLQTWQMLCGVCGRLDLIDKATTKNWRDRFPELDEWFRRNRPYIVWDDGNSCIRVDEDAKEAARPTPRSSRFLPELKPPWQPGTR